MEKIHESMHVFMFSCFHVFPPFSAYFSPHDIIAEKGLENTREHTLWWCLYENIRTCLLLNLSRDENQIFKVSHTHTHTHTYTTSHVHTHTHTHTRTQEIINHLRQNSHTTTYGTSMSGPVAQQIVSSLTIIMGEDGTNEGGHIRMYHETLCCPDPLIPRPQDSCLGIWE